jgi:hypothetical protein
VSAAPVREGGTGWYLYGIAPAGAAAPDAAAVDPQHEVVTVAAGGLAAIASRVSLDDFDESTLSERLGDAEWLEQKIRAHEQVLEAVLAGSAVVPCRFCTVYRDGDDLRGFLTAHSDELGEALARLEGRVELGVKAYVQRPRDLEAAQAESGRAYLEARRQEQHRREELATSRAQGGGELHDRLLSVAEDGVVLALQSREVSGRDEEMFFNGAYLVADQNRFEQVLMAVAGEQDELQLELTGPWPPYNFVPDDLGRR